MSTILLIENEFEKEELTKIISQYKNTKIFSLDYSAHISLSQNNILHHVGEMILTKNDLNEIDEKTINLTVNWWGNPETKKFVMFKEINLASLIEMELIYYFSDILRTVLIIQKIIESEKPTVIIASTNVNDFIKRISENNGIQVITFDSKPSSLIFDKINIKFNILSIPISFHISRHRFLTIKKFLEKSLNFIFKFNDLTKDDKNKKSILLLDFNPMHYHNLLYELSKLNKNIILLNQRRPAIHNIKSFNIVKNSKCKIITLKQFESKIKAIILNQLDQKMQDFNHLWQYDHIFEKVFSLHSHTFWYSIKKSFVNICNSRFKESIQRIMLLHEFFKEFNISVILEWAETGQEEKEVLYVAKKFGIKSVMLQHSMYPTDRIWEPFGRFLSYFTYPAISDKQAVYGELTKNFANSHGYNNDNLLVTGSPRHDEFFNYKGSSQNRGFILLATTGASGVTAEFSTTQNRENFDKFLKEIIRVVKLFPDKKLVVKIHPHQESFMPVIDFIKRTDPKIPIITNAYLPELINNCDILITSNNSTIALESIIMNKPTMSLQTERWVNNEEIVKMNAIVSINDLSQIENQLKKTLYDKKFRDNLQHNANFFLKKYLANWGYASKSLAQELDKF